jgi:hypothetical protein
VRDNDGMTTTAAPKIRCYGSGRLIDDMYVNPADYREPISCGRCEAVRMPTVSTYRLIPGDRTTDAYKVTFPYHTKVER